MECELNGRKIKYEDGKLWLWRETQGRQTLKVPYWREIKGGLSNTGYRQLKITGKSFKYHRVVYFIHNQEWNIHNSSQDNSIDHIDQDKDNNSIENLRVTTHSQNMWNQDRKGYSFNKSKRKYQAKIRLNYKDIHIGTFENPEDARQAYLEAKNIYHVMGDLK